MVVQAALFAGFLSAFLIELLRRLEPDPMDTIQDVLIYQTQMMRNSSLGPYVPLDFSPPGHIVVVNVFFYASLGVMILAAFTAMLIKSWVREFDRGLRAMSIPEQRAKTREFRYLGMERWKLTEMVGILPSLIQISLFLFSIGLIVFLFHISTPSFGVTTAIFAIGVLYYAVTTSISVLVTSSPFHSPPSRALGKVYQRVHAYFCPRVKDFQATSMDTTPVTTLGRFRRHIQSFLQKSRPYRETNFVKPILATTLDEVQLSTAASALQRIHERTPNSQHSEALQWSVWRVASSPAQRIPPSLNLPDWIVHREKRKEYFSHLPPDMVATLLVVWFRDPHARLSGTKALLNAFQRMDNPKFPCALLAAAFRSVSPGYFTKMMRKEELNRGDALWLLRTLSEFHSEGWLSQGPLFGICLAILSGDALKWNNRNPDIVLLEAVVTLAAISCCPSPADRQKVLTSSREYPWLFLNIRDPSLFNGWFEHVSSQYQKQLISLLWLVVYALISRRSIPLAVHYYTIITAKGDLPLYTSALAAIAPCMRDNGLSAIARMLVAPQPQDLISTIDGPMLYGVRTVQEELLKNYDPQLGASATPDPNLFAILLMLSKNLSLYEIGRIQTLDLKLKNPWLRLAARVTARLDIPDEFSLPMGLSYDHRFHNMIAALSLMRYTEGEVTKYTESLLLASFLQSREFAISTIALEYYMKTVLSDSGSSVPSSYLAGAVHAVFNVMLSDHQPQRGWEILEIFVNGFGDLPMEWRRTFAEGFFTLSRRPLPQSQGEAKTNTPTSGLQTILTWEYFHAKKNRLKLTDSGLIFSGLDWMAMAWSLHLSQQYGRKTEGPGQGEARSRGMSVPALTEEFVLRALFKLLDAASYYQIIPIITKLREFVQWFDDAELPESCFMISARIEKILYRHEDLHNFYKFQKFHCTWYM